MALLNFDASTVAPAAPPDPVPSGWYKTHITASEMKPTSNGAGAYLELEHTVLEPVEYAGRKVFDRLNLKNPNQTAVEIAYRTLSAICHATGVIQVTDSALLHNKPLMTKVSLRPAQTADQSGDGKPHDASNDVKGYKAVSSATVSAAPAPAAPAIPPAAPAAAPAAPAWAPPTPTPAQPAWAAAPAPATPTTQPAPAAQPVPAVPAAPAAAPAAAAAAPVPPWMQQPQG